MFLLVISVYWTHTHEIDQSISTKISTSGYYIQWDRPLNLESGSYQPCFSHLGNAGKELHPRRETRNEKQRVKMYRPWRIPCSHIPGPLQQKKKPPYKPSLYSQTASNAMMGDSSHTLMRVGGEGDKLLVNVNHYLGSIFFIWWNCNIRIFLAPVCSIKLQLLINCATSDPEWGFSFVPLINIMFLFYFPFSGKKRFVLDPTYL